jgi:hypothetical protein
MIRFVLFGTFLSLATLSAQVPGEAGKVEAALKILDGWHGRDAKKAERFLHFVLWTPKGRPAPQDYEGRLTRIMEHIRDFYGSEMTRLGFGPRSINLPYEKKGKLKVHLIEGKNEEAKYGKSSGNAIKQECLPVLAEKGIDGNKETLVIFCNLASWDEEKRRFSHESPYYAGGNFQGGTAWQLDSPELDTTNLPLKEPLIFDSQYGRISLGKHNSIFIGGICHELGHALGLPHCKERPDEAVRGTALMGSGNRSYGDELRGEGKGSFLTLAHALRLASHPQFSGSVKGMNLPGSAELDDLSLTAEGKAIKVSGRLTANPPAYAVVAYFDPDGGSDYNATTATAVPNDKGEFTLSCEALPKGKSGELRLIPLHVNGSTGGWMSQTKFRYPYTVREDGTPDLSTFQLKAELAPLVAALNRKDREKAVAFARQLPKGRASKIAERILARKAGKSPGGGEESGAATQPLTDFSPVSAKVGWGRAAYDFLPDSSMLLEAGGKIFNTGIYAHAPAEHRYALDGKWKKFTGSVGVASGKRGTVQFEIKGDGKSLWKSKVMKPGELQEFSVDLSEVKSLELLADPTADGSGSDWGLWLSPGLHR